MALFEFIEDTELRQKVEAAHNDALPTLISAAVDKEVSGLKTKNDELLGEKKKLQAAVKVFEGLDPVKAKEALDFLENNKDAQLIKDGKTEELITKRTSQIKTDYETKLSAEQSARKAAEEGKAKYKSKYHTKLVLDEVQRAAINAGVRPEALEDVLTRGGSIFSLGEDGTVEARDANGNLRKIDDDLVMTPKNWVEALKTSSPHYWPPSSGVGAGDTGTQDDLMAAADAAAASGDMVKYREIRAKMNKKKVAA